MKKALLSVFVIILTVQLIQLGCVQFPVEYEISTFTNKELYETVNEYRTLNGLEPLEWSKELEDVAHQRAVEQTDLVRYQHKSMSHTYGTDTGNCVELFSSRTGNEAVMDEWTTSLSLRSGLLIPDVEKIGIATGDYEDIEGGGVTVLLMK